MSFVHEAPASNALRALTIVIAAGFITGCASSSSCKPSDAALRAFQMKMRDAINENKLYPAEAVKEGVEGSVTMSFDYSGNGKATNIHVDKSSGSIYLDAAALVAVLRAKLPVKPCGFENINHFVFVENFNF